MTICGRADNECRQNKQCTRVQYEGDDWFPGFLLCWWGKVRGSMSRARSPSSPSRMFGASEVEGREREKTGTLRRVGVLTFVRAFVRAFVRSGVSAEVG